MEVLKSPDSKVAKAYSFSLSHIAKLRDLADHLGINPSQVVCAAVDEYYDRHIDQPAPEPQSHANPT